MRCEILEIVSFLLDPPLLVAAGAVIEKAVPEEMDRPVERAVVAVFLATSISLYLEVGWTRWLWRACRARSGRDWMLNSGVFRFDADRPSRRTHAVSAALFATYPLWPEIGRRLARRT